jgi:hypothetical protein
MTEHLELLPPQTIKEIKSQDQFQNQPVSLALSETTGVIFLGILCIMLFKAYRKLLEKYEELLKQQTL